MTFDQAETILKEAFPGKYCTVRYERGAFHTGESHVDIKMYVDGAGWTGDSPTFEAALQAMVLRSEGVTSDAEGIHD